jgi:alpha-L-arabinofuranosidase
MASYAPLFSNVNAWQWTPDLIWADSLQVCLTPSYHVQRLYSLNRGNRILPLDNVSVAEAKGIYASAVLDDAKNSVILKLVNPSQTPVPVRIQLDGRKAKRLIITQISGAAGSDENSFEHPERIAPTETIVELSSETLAQAVPARSFQVFRFD